MSKPALGRGLGALLGGAKPPAATPASPAPGALTPQPAAGPSDAGVRRVPLDRVKPSPLQPRKDFTEEALRELADSIREQGIVQPLIVRPVGDSLELIAGERRWRAARIAGLTDVPVIERTATDLEVLELALIENLQRENLNPIEEALGYAQLQTQFALTQEQVAQKVGRGRVTVANALRLLRLPAPAQDALRTAQLSVGHAKVILGLNDPRQQEAAVAKVIAEGLTVRQTEELVARLQQPATKTPGATPAPLTTRDPHVVDLESRLRDRFATRVGLRYTKGRGSIEIRFSTDDELTRILDLVGVAVD
jgi:ParB family transcriptional regulator, chromosome partitioning protein